MKTGMKQIVEHRNAEFVISTDNERLDLDLVHGFLTECYWARGIPREVVDRSIENSLCFGVYRDGKQVGFARVISDSATYAYIGDLFVLESYRGRGLGRWLMECIMQHPGYKGCAVGAWSRKMPTDCTRNSASLAEDAGKVYGAARPRKSTSMPRTCKG